MKTKRIAAYVLVVVFVLTETNLALAGWLSDAYNTAGAGGNITPGGQYQTTTARGYTNGGFTWRVPNQAIVPLQISPPTLSMGCNGIDAWGGAFQFVNVDKFVDTLRNMGQQSLGYFFSLALKTMAPEVSQTLDSIADIANKVNSLQIGGCKMAQDLVNGTGVKGWMEEKRKETVNFLRDSGAASDQSDADESSKTKTPAEILVAAEKECQAMSGPNDPLCEESIGTNYLYWALAVELGGKKPSQWTPTTDDVLAINLLMSVIGSSGHNDQGVQIPTVGGGLKLEALIGDATTTFVLNKCNDALCLAVGTQTEPSLMSALSAGMTKINAAIGTQIAPTLTAMERTAISRSSYPLYRAAALNSGVIPALAQATAASTASQMIHYYSRFALNGLAKIKSKNTKTANNLTLDIENNIKDKLLEIDKHQRKVMASVGSPAEVFRNLEMIERDMHNRIGFALVANAKFNPR